MSFTVTVDTSMFRKQNGTFKRSFATNFKNWLNLGREWHAYNAFLVTLPHSRKGSLWPVKQLQDRIEADMRHTFPVSDPPALNDDWARGVYKMIKVVRDEPTAKRWWGTQWMPDKNGRGERFDMDTGEVVFDIDSAQAAKTLLAGHLNFSRKDYGIVHNRHPLHLPPSSPPLAMLTTTKLEAQIRKRKRRAGLAKAGWRAAVKGSGVRATRGSQVNIIWPRETPIPIREVGGPVAGTSSLNIMGANSGVGNWVIINHVPHIADYETFEQRARDAHQNTQRHLQFYFRTRMAALARLAFNSRQRAAASAAATATGTGP